MKTQYIETSVPAHLSRDPGDFSLVAAAQLTEWGMKSAARRRASIDAEKNAKDNIVKYTPETQPRDDNGRFRQILARLKTNLGPEGTEELAKKIESAEQAQVAGDYVKMREAGGDVIKMINDVKEGDLPKGVTSNLRRGATQLSRVLAYLPLPQGDPNAKIRFSDLPPASSDLVRTMIKRVVEQLGQEKADKYVRVLNEFMSGARTMTSDEMSSNLNKLLRVLA